MIIKTNPVKLVKIAKNPKMHIPSLKKHVIGPGSSNLSTQFTQKLMDYNFDRKQTNKAGTELFQDCWKSWALPHYKYKLKIVCYCK